MKTRGAKRLAVSVFSAFLILNSLGTSNCLSQSVERLEPSDWFAGDAHLHRTLKCGRSDQTEMLTPEQLLGMMKPNNLAVISVLSGYWRWGRQISERRIFPRLLATTIRYRRLIALCIGVANGTTIPRCHLPEQGDRRTPDFPWFGFWEAPFSEYTYPGLCVGKTTWRTRRIRTHAVFALRVLPATRRHPSFA